MDNPYQEKTPGQLAQGLLELAHTYGELSDELEEILKLKDINWSMLRDQFTSDKQTDREWGRTKPGSREIEIELEMKKIRRTMSAIKTYLSVKENEARNLY